MENLSLLISVSTTWFMTGVIWMTQMTQYPSFKYLRTDEFPKIHDEYRLRITFIAAFPMVLEVGSAAALLIYRPDSVRIWEAWAAAGALVLVWGSTFLLQVPIHERLSRGFEESDIRRLIATNWLRTFGWTFRAVLAGVWIYRVLET